MKTKSKIIGVIALIFTAGLYYYLALPAINIHSADVWFFVLFLVAAAGVIYAVKNKIGRYEIRNSKVLKSIISLFVILLAIYAVGTILSSPIVNAKKYQSLLTVQEGEFTKDVEELSFDQIPILDKDSAIILGERKMGSMSDMVSQFEVDDSIYSQINYQDRPVRVSPVRYESLSPLLPVKALL